MRTASLHVVVAMLAIAYLSESACTDMNVDPTGLPLWSTIQQKVFGAARTTFDSRIGITGSAFTEDAMQVPIAFDALTFGKVERIVAAADRNPIRKMLEFTPMHVRPALSLRFKLQETSAMCVAACTPDGVWYVGTLQVDVIGSGCTLPGATRQNITWSTTLNQVESRVFSGFNDVGSRIRLCVTYPMDTDLVAGILSSHTEQLNLLDARYQPMLELALYEPVAENPIFSFDLDGLVGRGISVAGVDNNSNRICVQVTQ